MEPKTYLFKQEKIHTHHQKRFKLTQHNLYTISFNPSKIQVKPNTKRKTPDQDNDYRKSNYITKQ